MKKVEIAKLNGLSLDEGEKLLLENGYIRTNEIVSNDIDDICIEDIYFTLFDEEDNAIHQITYSSYWHGSPADIETDYFKREWQENQI